MESLTRRLCCGASCRLNCKRNRSPRRTSPPAMHGRPSSGSSCFSASCSSCEMQMCIQLRPCNCIQLSLRGRNPTGSDEGAPLIPSALMAMQGLRHGLDDVLLHRRQIHASAAWLQTEQRAWRWLLVGAWTRCALRSTCAAPLTLNVACEHTGRRIACGMGFRGMHTPLTISYICVACCMACAQKLITAYGWCMVGYFCNLIITLLK
jgi:hypothetical protein